MYEQEQEQVSTFEFVVKIYPLKKGNIADFFSSDVSICPGFKSLRLYREFPQTWIRNSKITITRVRKSKYTFTTLDQDLLSLMVQLLWVEAVKRSNSDSALSAFGNCSTA